MLLNQRNMKKIKIPVVQNIIVLLATLTFIIFDYIEGVPISNKGIVPLEESITMERITLLKQERFMNLYSEMIGILHDLNVLPEDRNITSCMSLEGIRRQVSSPYKDGVPRQVAVVLYFKEAQRSESVSSNRSPSSPICKRRTGYGMFAGLNSDSLKKGSGNSTTTSKKENNATSALGGPHSGIKVKGLSRTQIAVIVTCAVVLGSFFIIAGALRVRSCLKRYRISREAALSVTRRTSNIGLNGTSLNPGTYRKESSSSKASRQSFADIKDGSDLQIDRQNRALSNTSHNSSPSHNHDHTPLLPVWSNKQGTETGSQHGSLDGSMAFIDDESQSKAKDNPMDAIESDMESEENPLLRKSPDSGSSLDVTMADVYSTGRDSPMPDKIPGQESERRTSDVTSVDRSVSDLPEMERRASGAPNLERRVSDAPSIDSKNEDGSIEALPEINIMNKNFSRKKRFSFAGRGHECEVKLVRRASLPRKQASIDSYTNEYNEYSDYGNNGIYVWPEEDEEQNMMMSHAVNIGLNQSNSSISENPSYSYGNQTEYMYNGGYGNIAYSSPNMNHHLDNCLYIENCECDNTSSNINVVFNNGDHNNGVITEDMFNKNESLSPSDISSASLSISKDSSGEPLLSQHNQHSRTPSNGTNKLSGADNLALTDSGEDDEPSTAGPAQCTVVSQIVSIAEYHRNSVC